MTRRSSRRVPNWAVGLAVVVAVAAGLLLAFSPLLRIELPWQGGFELRATFAHAQSLAVGSPVRIAGVDVGEVESVESVPPGAAGAGGTAGGAALVTMELSEKALPIHADARLRIRPRLFLEGNYFIELSPGSPSAPELGEEAVLPRTATASSPQLDQVLTTLQADVRTHFRTVLDQLGNALVRRDGAKALNELNRHSGGAFGSTARVSQALLGTEPHDLSGTIDHLQDVVAALDRHEPQLQGSVTHLATVSTALAAEAERLERAVAELPETIEAGRPALAALNDALPQVRAFALDATPGLRTLPPALDSAVPFLRQVRRLASRRELRGLARHLRPTVPKLAALARRTVPVLDEARALTSCFNEVVIPWSNLTVPDPETPATGRVFEETTYGLAGIGGESRSGDANGPYIRVLFGGGANTVQFPAPPGTSDPLFGVTPLPLLGARPSLASSAKTPFRPDVPCERQQPPNLDSGQAAQPPDQAQAPAPAAAVEPTPELRVAVEGAARRLRRARSLTGPGVVSGRNADQARELISRALDGLNTTLAKALGIEASLEGGR